jgi:uncharacterized protein
MTPTDFNRSTTAPLDPLDVPAEELHGAEADRAVRLLAERIRSLVADTQLQLPTSQDGAEHEGSVAAEPRPVLYRIILTERTGRYDKRPEKVKG